MLSLLYLRSVIFLLQTTTVIIKIKKKIREDFSGMT